MRRDDEGSEHLDDTQTPRPRTVGVVGLGNIGENLCRCLLGRGFTVTVHDLDPSRAAKLADAGAGTAGSPAEVASASDAVVLSLPNSDVVERVVSGEEGLLEGLSERDVVIDTSSSRPPSTRGLAKVLSRSGVAMLDAPVSGGVSKAREGRLSVMVGGEEEVFERCREVLEAFGEKVVRVGDSGTGHLMKSLNNMLSATTLVSAAEAMILARRAGVAPETFVDVINAGNGRSYSTEVKFPNFVLDGNFDEDGFALGLMAKDLRIALESALDAGHPMVSGSVIAQIWQSAERGGYGERGHTSIYEFLEGLSGADGRDGDGGG